MTAESLIGDTPIFKNNLLSHHCYKSTYHKFFVYVNGHLNKVKQ